MVIILYSLPLQNRNPFCPLRKSSKLCQSTFNQGASHAVTALIFNKFLLLLLTNNLYFSLTGSHFILGCYTRQVLHMVVYNNSKILKTNYFIPQVASLSVTLVIYLDALWLAVLHFPSEHSTVLPGMVWYYPV